MTKKHICIIKLSALGDFFIALGAMKTIRAHHKDAVITLLTTKPFADMALQSGYVDDVVIDTKPALYNIPAWINSRKQLNKPFTRIYDLQNNDRTALYKTLLFSAQSEWVGITKPEKKAHRGHAFDRHAQMLENAGLPCPTPDTLDWLMADIGQFNTPKPYVLMVPGCAPQHPYKRWPQDHYKSLAKRLGENGKHVVIIGTQHETDIAAHIATAGDHVMNVAGQTSLAHIPELARHAMGAIGNDTGPIHMIGMTGCPTLVLFSGHSDPVKSKPLGQNVRTLRNDPLDALTVQTVIDALPFQ